MDLKLFFYDRIKPKKKQPKEPDAIKTVPKTVESV